ncbi:MAG: addiction module protein [Gemmataceae bacterium]|nr:addiction module protein [Gemmataceae bacterium]
MTDAVRQLWAQIERLSFDERVELMDLIQISLPEEELRVIEKAWEVEVERRMKDVRSGKTKGIPGEQVLAELRKKYP